MSGAAAEFEVGGNVYRAAPLDVFAQFEVSRRLSQVLSYLAIAKTDATPEAIGQAITALSGSLPEEDVKAALHACLATVQRKQQGGYAPVRSASGVLMFHDIRMREMIAIVFHVLKHNDLIDFFAVPAAKASDEQQSGM